MRDKVRQYLANTRHRKGEEDYFSPQVFTRSSEYLELAREAQPFFLVVDSFDPHEPWDPPEKYVNMYSDGYDGPEPIVPNYSKDDWITDSELERMKTLYAAEVTMVDHWLGNFLNRVDDLGLAENTLLMVFADHGVALGEHGYTGKPYPALYPELTDIPFFIRHPEGKGAGQTSDFYASIHDIAPTVLSLLGIEQLEEMNGEDISPILDGGQPSEARPHFTLGYDNYVWARDERYIMTARNDRTEEKLFDLNDDPDMKNDIAGDHPDIVKHMFEDYVLADAGGPLPKY